MWKFANPIRHKILETRWPTADEAAWSRLFSPIAIGRLEARSRTWVPAMVPWRATEDGFVTEQNLDWYRRFAEGCPGVLVVEATGVRDISSGPLLRIGDDDVAARIPVRVRDDVAQLGVVVEESAGTPRGNITRLYRMHAELCTFAGSYGFAAMQPHGGRIGARHVDGSFFDGNAHFTAAAANLELSTNDADLNIIDRHRERPSGVVRDCEVRIAADNSRATLVLRDVEVRALAVGLHRTESGAPLQWRISYPPSSLRTQGSSFDGMGSKRLDTLQAPAAKNWIPAFLPTVIPAKAGIQL